MPLYTEGMRLNENKNYLLSDIGCTSALVTAGFQLKNIDKSNRKKAVFIFELSKELTVAVQDYWVDNLQVSARRFHENMKMIKSRLYEYSGDTPACKAGLRREDAM